MIRPTTFSEAKSFGVGVTILCDECKRVIDIVKNEDDLRAVNTKEMYAPPHYCWRCFAEKGK